MTEAQELPPALSTSSQDLPAGWAIATLPDLISPAGVLTDGDWVESKDQDPEGEVRLIQLADVSDGVFRSKSNRFLTAEKSKELRCTLLRQGDVLVARMPDPLGRSCLFPALEQPCCTVVDVCVVRPGTEGVSPGWLMHFINSSQFRGEIAARQSGSTRKRISKKNLCTILLPVPPSKEQTHLAETLDSYLSRLDAAQAALERAQANLDRYRASVLQAAVEGRLVPTEAELARDEGRAYEPASLLLERVLIERRQRWEEAELAKMRAKGNEPKNDKWKQKYKEPVAPDTSHLPELPEGWCRATLDQLGWTSGYGTSVKCGPAADGVPVLRIPNIVASKLDLADLKFATKDIGIKDEELIARGDFLVVRTNGSRSLIGRAAHVAETPNSPLYFASYLIRFRLVGATVGRWISHFWNAPTTRQHLESLAATTAGQYNLSMTKLAPVVVALPPAAEQERLGDALDVVLSVAGVTSEQGQALGNRMGNLRAAILKWAFEGKLAAQDPTDEPASALLDRIRAEREAATPARRRRRKLKVTK